MILEVRMFTHDLASLLSRHFYVFLSISHARKCIALSNQRLLIVGN